MEPNNFSQEEINDINERLSSFIEEAEYSFDGEAELPSYSTPADYDFLDDSFSDIDFSDFKGDFKKNIKKINTKINSREPKPVKRKLKALSKEFGAVKKTQIIGKTPKGIGKVIVPRDRKVIKCHEKKYSQISNPPSVDILIMRFGFSEPSIIVRILRERFLFFILSSTIKSFF